MDKERRTFLKIILIGSGTLLAGKVLGPLLSRCLNDSLSEAVPAVKTASKSFRIVENEKILSIYDNMGEEIFQIDKEA